MRGLAALSVLVCHFLSVYPFLQSNTFEHSSSAIGNVLKFTPLHFFWLGFEPVIFFFILSGFVLSLPFLNGVSVKYSSFLIKRIFRLYIPYLIAVLVAISMRAMFSRGGIPELSEWFNSEWHSPITNRAIIDHILFLGNYDSTAFNGVIWTLIIEMKVSLIFPLLIICIKRFNWALNMFLGVAIYYLDARLKLGVGYALMFIIGALLAKHRDGLVISFNKLSKGTKITLMVVAVLVYTYRWWFLWDIKLLHPTLINNLMICLGVSIIIIAALSSNAINSLLSKGLVEFMGRISYSLYLYHVVVLLTLVNILYRYIPLWNILLISLPTTIFISWVGWYVIERNSMRLARRIIRSKPNKKDSVELSTT